VSGDLCKNKKKIPKTISSVYILYLCTLKTEYYEQQQYNKSFNIPASCVGRAFCTHSSSGVGVGLPFD
jgi:hypothetical protein